MDAAVRLVQAYLRINGFFTVTDKHGFSDTDVGTGMHCRIRWIGFGGTEPEVHRPYYVVPLRHMAQFLSGHIDEHQDVFLKTQLKDEALDLLALLVKVGLSLEPQDGGIVE